jgi:hypothetical protein
MDHATPLGKMTIFYIPSHKLDAPGPVGEHTPRGQIHEFLMQHYRAYTHTPSPVKGCWSASRFRSSRRKALKGWCNS